jgi:hypothetical protein
MHGTSILWGRRGFKAAEEEKLAGSRDLYFF